MTECVHLNEKIQCFPMVVFIFAKLDAQLKML